MKNGIRFFIATFIIFCLTAMYAAAAQADPCEQWSATNTQHVSAGRAYTQSQSSGCSTTTTYYAVGSDQNLGTSGSTTTTLNSTDGGQTYQMGDCPGTEPGGATFNGTYSMVAVHSGKALDTWEWGTTDGTNIAQYNYWGGEAQQFIITPVDGIWHRITPVIAPNQALDVAGCVADDGANIQTWTYWGGNCQQFRFEDAGDGAYQIIARNSEMCVDVADASLEDGANVIQSTCLAGAEHQMFELIAHSNGGEPNDGDIILSPGDDLQSAINALAPGKTIWLNGGTYNMSATIMIAESNAGTAAAMKTIATLGTGMPVLDWNSRSDNSSARGIILDGSYWQIYGITIREAGDNGMLLSGDNNIIERCVFAANRDTGLQISRYNGSYNSISQWPTNNLVLQCESYDNADSDGEDADGFAAKLTCGEGNVFQGCYAHHNIDDGWDLFTNSYTGKIGRVTIADCIAYRNGTLIDGTINANGDRNGFKLGGQNIAVNHIVHHCIAVENGKTGFTYNSNPGNIDLYNNTAYRNGSSNYYFASGNHTFMNNISLSGGSNDRISGSSLNPTYNAWWTNGIATAGNGVTVTSSDFQSLSIGAVTWVADYGVNLGRLLIPAVGSDLIGTGLNGANMGAR